MVALQLPQELYDKLIKDAKADDRTLSAYIRKLLNEHYQKED